MFKVRSKNTWLICMFANYDTILWQNIDTTQPHETLEKCVKYVHWGCSGVFL